MSQDPPLHRRRVRGPQDLLAGVIVVALAAAVLQALARIATSRYEAISPALFPKVCAWLLLASGCVLIVRGLTRHGPSLERLPLRPVILVTVAIVAFGAVTPLLGYGIAGFLTMLIAGLATPEVRLRELIAVALGLIALSIVLFSTLLGLTIPIVILPWGS